MENTEQEYKSLSFEEPKDTGRYIVYDSETQIITGAYWSRDLNNGKMCFLLDSGGRRYQDLHVVLYKKEQIPKMIDVLSQYRKD